MSALLGVIRTRSSDGRVDARELDEILEVAAEDGVAAHEVDATVDALRRTTSGFTPAHRARMWVRLSALDEQVALRALARAPASLEGADALAEIRERVVLLAEEIDQARTDARSLGGDDPVVEALRVAQERLLVATEQLRALLDLPRAEQQAIFAGFDYSARWRWQQVQRPVDPGVLVGLDPAHAEKITAPFPNLPTAGNGDSFAGIQFAGPTAWTFKPHSGTLELPEGAEIRSFPKRGLFRFSGVAVTLPAGGRLNGAAVVTDGRLALETRARLDQGGIQVIATARSTVALKDGVLTGGPGLSLELPVLDAAPAGAQTQTVRFALNDSTLPDGTEVKRARGELQAVFEGGVAIGFVRGSVSLRAGSTVIARATPGQPLEIPGRAGPGRLLEGGALIKDGVVIGLVGGSEAEIDGIRLRSKGGVESAEYAFRAPSTYVVGPGMTVEEIPSDRDIIIRGQGARVTVEGRTVELHSGGLDIRAGELAGLLGNSKVSFAEICIETGRRPITMLHGEPALWPEPNSMFIDGDVVGVAGQGITLLATDRSKLLRAGRDEVFDLPFDNGVTLRDGSVRLSLLRRPARPTGVAVQITGNVAVTSGGWGYDPAKRSLTVPAREPAMGPFMRIDAGGKAYEIDPRPIWPNGRDEDTGRMRALPEVFHPGRFGGSLLAETRAILEGRRTLAEGARGELVRRIQQSLRYFLGDRPGADGGFGPKTLEAVRAFQRLQGLPATGIVDRVTLRRLDDVSPPDDEQYAERPKVMVMVAMNNDVPDELRRFKQLAAERGAQPVIIGLPDSRLSKPEDLRLIFEMAERGEIDFDWLLISGHSTGDSTWGKHGTLDYDDLDAWAKMFPAAAAQVEKLQLQNCYNVTVERASSYWPDMFPNVTALEGYMYSAPGKKAQSSDENILHSGRLMHLIRKGAVADRSLADRIARTYVNDRYVKWQNASIFVRYEKPDGTIDSVFEMTSSARYEMRRHGAGEELEVTAFQQQQEFRRYLNATDAGYEEPPAQHHSGPLREYLNAVDGVLGRWEVRLRQLVRHRARAEADPNYEMPEEFRSTYGWESEVDELRDLRGQILFLIYFDQMRVFFDQKYGPTIDALNELLESHGSPERFPRGESLHRMPRKDVLAVLDRLQGAVAALPSEVSYGTLDVPQWRIMKGTDPAVTEAVSPRAFMERAVAFLKDLSPDYIAAEWL